MSRGDASLTAAASSQRILAIADDPTVLKRLADAIQAGGASPVLVRGAKMLDQAPGPLPFRFAVYAWDGTEEGLKLYENDSRLSQSHWFKNDAGAPPITATDIQLLDEQGRERTVFQYGERMTVRIRYQTTRPIIRPDIRIGVNRSDEVHCCTYNTAADGVDVPVLDGEGWIEMTTPPLNFVSEMYMTTVNFREHGAAIASQIGASFHVAHPTYDPNSYGVFHEGAQWRLKALETRHAEPLKAIG